MPCSCCVQEKQLTHGKLSLEYFLNNGKVAMPLEVLLVELKLCFSFAVVEIC
jgi:hypothetical protein